MKRGKDLSDLITMTEEEFIEFIKKASTSTELPKR
jgi:hypothetical protein